MKYRFQLERERIIPARNPDLSSINSATGDINHTIDWAKRPSLNWPSIYLVAPSKGAITWTALVSTQITSGNFQSKGDWQPITISSGSRVQGLYSLSGKTSYRQISWSLEAARSSVILIVLLWNLTGISTTLLLICLWNFRATGKV